MSELGRQLKEARLQKGMSLDDVQEVTKFAKVFGSHRVWRLQGASRKFLCEGVYQNVCRSSRHES